MVAFDDGLRSSHVTYTYILEWNGRGPGGKPTGYACPRKLGTPEAGSPACGVDAACLRVRVVRVDQAAGTRQDRTICVWHRNGRKKTFCKRGPDADRGFRRTRITWSDQMPLRSPPFLRLPAALCVVPSPTKSF
jgi:hypothetical protein